VALGFEFRALCLLGKYCTPWVTLPAPFALGYFSDKVSCFLSGASLCILFSWDYRHARLCLVCLLKLDFANFCSVSPRTTILLISTSLVAWIAGVEHQVWLICFVP
jgi:hypothetical protein